MVQRPRGGGPRREDDDGDRGDRDRERHREHERRREEPYDDPDEHHRIEKHRFAGGLPATPERYVLAREQWNLFAWRHRQAIHESGAWRPGSRAAVAGADLSGREGARTMSLNGTVWAPIGRSPIDQGAISANGQVTAIAINPNNPKIIYMAHFSAQPGVASGSRATGGNTWTPIFDRAPSLGVGDPGALAIDPVNTNIVYVGTSSREGSQFSGEATQPPAGLFKSTDGGASWIRLGSGYPSGPPSNASILFSQRITVVLVDPANTQTLYLASSAGLFVSTDGGFNWTQGVAPAGDVRSLALDATSPAGARILYAGVSGVGVVQSTDGGGNWHVILNAATPAVAAALAGGGFGKVVVALAPPASPASPAGIQVLYVTMVGTGAAPPTVGLFQSTDQGNTWNARAATGLAAIIASPQGGYSFLMAVDPQSPGDGLGDIVYFGNQFQARSLDAGASFAALSGLHADTHAWAFSPQPGPFSVAYCGNDGGFSSNAPAARPSRLSMLAGFRRRCSTTSTSRRTRQRA